MELIYRFHKEIIKSQLSAIDAIVDALIGVGL